MNLPAQNPSDPATELRLQKWWTDFAGSQSSLSFRTPLSPLSKELENDLAFLCDIFVSTTFRSRYLEIPAALKNTPSPERLVQWAESRRALVVVLKNLLKTCADPLKIRVSLSHSVAGCIAVGRISDSVFSGIGVDLETASRKISDAAAARFLYQPEIKMGLTALDSWVVKEACYKADPENEERVVADYHINSFTPDFRGEATVIKNSSSQFNFALNRSTEFALAAAMSG